MKRFLRCPLPLPSTLQEQTIAGTGAPLATVTGKSKAGHQEELKCSSCWVADDPCMLAFVPCAPLPSQGRAGGPCHSTGMG
jgi:hypothetical protein